MGRAEELTPEQSLPWVRSDVAANVIASADWCVRHPALCYEVNDPHGDQFIHESVITAVLQQPRFVVILHQPRVITFVDLEHEPQRTFIEGSIKEDELPPANWCDLTRHEVTPFGTKFWDIKERIDPRIVMPQLFTILQTTLGCPPDQQNLVPTDQPVMRIVIEFCEEIEDRALPLDTTITTLAELATQEYLDTISGRATL